MQYSDIGILLRKLTNAHLYVDALCARGIPIVIEGEKFLYRTQEVIDLLNLLKYIIDEIDAIALAGMLRSPLFGLDDLELALFFQQHNAGADVGASLDAALDGAPPERTAVLQTFLNHVTHIRRNMGQMNPGTLLEEVLARFPILTVAGIAYGPHRRELAPLNILKIHKQALEADLNPEMTVDRFVRVQEEYSVEGKDTEQETTADEAVQAVRLLSIHKSKGLDFPVVFVPLTDHGAPPSWQRTAVIHDWQTGATGIKISGFTEDNYLRLRYRQEAPVFAGDPMLAEIGDEERRVLYVAATRAKQRMYFSFVEKVTGKDSSQGWLLFDFLKTIHPSVPETPEPAAPWFPEPKTEAAAAPFRSLGDALRGWERVAAARAQAALPLIRTVTAEAAICHPEDIDPGPPRLDSAPQLVGILCHGVLERIDFSAPENLPDLLEAEAAKRLYGYPPEACERARAEASAILDGFLHSPAAGRLASAEILGREVPVAVFHSGNILTGQIDLIIREAESCTVIDYKTNRHLNDHDLELYRAQLSLYAQSIAPLLPAPPVLQLCLLRTGEFLTLPA
jgi:ATP-dependent helicase/nuclease subunit A